MNLQKIANALNPWREIDRLGAALRRAEARIALLDASLATACDRYDGLREANAQLRDTLTLYRNNELAAVEADLQEIAQSRISHTAKLA